MLPVNVLMNENNLLLTIRCGHRLPSYYKMLYKKKKYLHLTLTPPKYRKLNASSECSSNIVWWSDYVLVSPKQVRVLFVHKSERQFNLNTH